MLPSRKQRFAKAQRHFRDAIYLRGVRHDLDSIDSSYTVSHWIRAIDASSLIRGVYEIQTSPEWSYFLTIVTLSFLILTGIEPSTENDQTFFEWRYKYYGLLLGGELTAIVMYIIDVILEVVHRSRDKRKSTMSKFFKNGKFLLRVAFICCFIVDLLVFHIYYNTTKVLSYRLSRFLRPRKLVLCTLTNWAIVMLFFFSKNLRRHFQALIRTTDLMLVLLVLYVIIASLYAAIGVKIIPNLSDDPNYDEHWSNFGDFGHAFNSLWIVLGGEGYPQIMYPALRESKLYLLYFLPYLAMAVLVWDPIPVAIFFNKFKEVRGNRVVMDQITEREALFTCFAAIHSSMYLPPRCSYPLTL